LLGWAVHVSAGRTTTLRSVRVRVKIMGLIITITD
jgi:hypothetical protein